MDFSVDTTEVEKNLDTFEGRVNAAVDMYCSTVAQNWSAQAKANRPWTDRTGHAREGLTGSSGSREENSVSIVLAHTVDYGLWLELAHEKNYAIVEPTVRLESPNAIQGMNNLLGRIRV